MSLLLGCQQPKTLQTHYTNPISIQVVEAEKEDHDMLFLLLGLQNRSSTLMVTEQLSVDVSGLTTVMDLQIHLPAESQIQTRVVVPFDPSLDRLRVIGKVTTTEQEYLAIFDRTVELTRTEHHHH